MDTIGSQDPRYLGSLESDGVDPAIGIILLKTEWTGLISEEAQMNPNRKNIEVLLSSVRSRIKAQRALGGLAVTVAIAAASLALAAVLAHSLAPGRVILTLLRLAPFGMTIAAVWFFVVKPLKRQIADDTLARLVEERR